VNKGDKVRLFATNIDKASGITKNPDVTMGLTIYGPYGQRSNMDLPRGVTAVHEFTADMPANMKSSVRTSADRCIWK